MAKRAMVFKAPYGAAFMMQSDGSIWVMYDNSFKGTSDNDMLNWIRDTAIKHADMVERQIVAEHQAKQKELAMPGVSKDSRVIQEIRTSLEPENMNKPLEHDWGGPYRIGAKCKVCDVAATGFEKRLCSGVKPVAEEQTELAVLVEKEKPAETT